jgi:hypothetical protein
MILNCTEKNLNVFLMDARADGFELIQVQAGLSRTIGGMNVPEMETRFKLFFKKEIELNRNDQYQRVEEEPDESNKR